MSTQNDLQATASAASKHRRPKINGKIDATNATTATDDASCDDHPPQKASAGFGKRLCEGPVLRYLGISLLLAYHYVLWFVPDSFFHMELLNDHVTYSWLTNLTVVSVTVIIAGLYTNKKRHLTEFKELAFGAPILLIVSTLCLQTLTSTVMCVEFPIVFSAIAGVSEGIMLILYAECLNRIGAHFSSINTGFTFGITTLVCMLAALLLPNFLTPIFASILALASAIILIYVNTHVTRDFPQLLPRKAVKPATKNMIIISIVMFFVSMSLYYLAAIIPWEDLILSQATFVLGPIFASITLMGIATVCYIFRNRNLTFQFLPWFMVCAIAAFALFLASTAFYNFAFCLALTISSLLEVSLIIYLGVLIWRGYFAPGRAVAFGIASIRLGIAAGNGLAVFYEHYPLTAQPLIDNTALIFIVLIAAMLVPMVKREFIILDLTSAPPAPSDLDVTCQQIIEEFKLSEREGEILKLIARDNTANSVASKLVISPHTVNTHIRHIYEKIGIHKRGELIEYINMRKDE